MSAYLTLGSNLGSRAANVQASLAAIRQRCGQVVATSFMYETAPQLVEDQPNFINAACHLRTDLAPAQLLQVVKDIERDLGRDQHGVRYGPRVIDIDLALYGNSVVDIANGDRSLQIPHLRLGERDFVLKPLCDLDRGLVVPATGSGSSASGSSSATVGELLRSLQESSDEGQATSGIAGESLKRVMPVKTCGGDERLWAWGQNNTKT
jgi:dihydroneopterin aldolase/2-amino-4-hydroxy-6-hydroxymethyldihydropteridine diphosphokinase/dihydropteroate synthase